MWENSPTTVYNVVSTFFANRTILFSVGNWNTIRTITVHVHGRFVIIKGYHERVGGQHQSYPY